MGTVDAADPETGEVATVWPPAGGGASGSGDEFEAAVAPESGGESGLRE